MSNRPHKDGEEVTNPKHVFNDPRHRELIGRVRSSTTSGSPKKEPTSPGSEKKRKGFVPGRRHFGALAKVLKPRSNTGQEPEGHGRPKSRDISWSDWPVDEAAARHFYQERKEHEGHKEHEAYYNSDDEDVNPKGEGSSGPDRHTRLLPPPVGREPPHARHSATPYREVVHDEERRVYGDEEAHPKWI